MKLKTVKTIKECIISKDDAIAAKWRDSSVRDKVIPSIYGEIAKTQAEGKTILGNLSDGVKYTFYETPEKKLVAVRVSMSAKTQANYSKGWSNFGSESFMKDL